MITNNGEGNLALSNLPLQVQHRSRLVVAITPSMQINDLGLSPPIKTLPLGSSADTLLPSMQRFPNAWIHPAMSSLTKAMMIVYRDNGPARIAKVPDDASDQPMGH